MDNPTGHVPAPAPAADGDLAVAPPDLTGRTLGDFHIIRRLGEGGMGQVYLGEQLSLKRPVALKILKAELAANTTALKRFKAEAEAVARATHPNIVQVYAIGEAEGLHYMALEYIEGMNLRDYLIKKGPPPLPLALSIMRQGAAALQRAAELGIIHRDVKPENILLTRKGAVKIADFGLSRCLAGDRPPPSLTQSGITMGTPLYMSPEQVEGRPLDPRTDIYSFGVTCYHMLAGHPPFRGETAFEVALQHVQATPDPLDKIRPDLPAELCAVIHRMMARDPNQRYQTARDLFKDLTWLRENLTGVSSGITRVLPAAERPAAEGKGSPPPPRWGLRWLAVGTVVLALVTGAAMGLQNAPETAPPAREPPPDAAVSGQAKREKALLETIHEYTNPSRPIQRMNMGVRPCMELGQLYLEQWRLDEADRFFLWLMDLKRSREYTSLGQLGHAMVLAFRNQEEESTKLILELIDPQNERVRMPFGINRSPGFLKLFVKALDYNALNFEAALKPFPKELQALRRPFPLPRRGGRPGLNRPVASRSPGPA